MPVCPNCMVATRPHMEIYRYCSGEPYATQDFDVCPMCDRRWPTSEKRYGYGTTD